MIAEPRVASRQTLNKKLSGRVATRHIAEAVLELALTGSLSARLIELLTEAARGRPA